MKKVIVSLVSALILLMPVSTFASTTYYVCMSNAQPHIFTGYKVVNYKKVYILTKKLHGCYFHRTHLMKGKDFKEEGGFRGSKKDVVKAFHLALKNGTPIQHY